MKKSFEFQKYRDELAEKIKDEGGKEKRKEILEKEKNTPQYKAAKLLHKEDIREAMEITSPEKRSLELEKNKIEAQEKNRKELEIINRDFYNSAGEYSYKGGIGFGFRLSEKDKKDNIEATKLVVEFIKNNIERFSDAGYQFHIFPLGGGTNIHEINLRSPIFSTGSEPEDTLGGETLAQFNYDKDTDADGFISKAKEALKSVPPRHKRETSEERKKRENAPQWWQKPGMVWNATSNKK